MGHITFYTTDKKRLHQQSAQSVQTLGPKHQIHGVIENLGAMFNV